MISTRKIKHMKKRFLLFQRSGVFYYEDTTTGKQRSFRTRDKADAVRLLHVKNEATHQPAMNLQIAQVYLQHGDPTMATRTWQEVMAQIVNTKHGNTQTRWRVAIKDKALDGLRECKLIQTLPEHFLAALQSGTVATNVYLRRIHHFAVAMHGLPWPVLPKLHWPPIQFAHKRAVTLDEHRKLMARETSPARRAFYELLWHFGGSQSDMARLTAEDIDWQRQTVAYVRCKTGTPAVQAFGPEVVAILRTLPTAGPLFPTLAEQTPGDRAAFFNYQMRKLGISGVTLHSYRYAWAERAKVAGYPERFAMQALGHASKAVHRAYAKSAEVVLPPLEDYEAPKGNAPAPVAGVLPEGSRN